MKTYSVAIKPLSCIVQITKNPSFADLDANGIISTKEAMALGLTHPLTVLPPGLELVLLGSHLFLWQFPFFSLV